jgi:hypothetical protein
VARENRCYVLRAEHKPHNGSKCRGAGDTNDKKPTYGGLKVGIKERRSALACNVRPQGGIQEIHSIDIDPKSSPTDDVIGLNLAGAAWLFHDEANAVSNRTG